MGRSGIADNEYYEITCVDTGCMKRFSHRERWFKLVPPADVEATFQNSVTQVEASSDYNVRDKQSSYSASRTRFDDDDDDDNDNDDESGGEDARPAAPPPPPPASVSSPDARMQELLGYYYNNGEPVYIAQHDERLTDDSRAGRLYRIYHKNDIRTGFVTSICDKYGNNTTTAVCPYCKSPLPPKAGRNRMYIIPVVGVSRSGKTVALTKGLHKFLDECIPYALPSGAASRDAVTMDYLDQVEYIVDKNGMIDGTLKVEKLTWTVDRGNDRQFYIMTFDVPGEHIANAQGAANEQFRKINLKNLLENADALVVIICPEQIRKLTTWDIDTPSKDTSSEGRSKDLIRSMEAMVSLMQSEADPNETFRSRRTPVVMLLTKLDMLKQTYPGDTVRKDVDATLRDLMDRLIGMEPYKHNNESYLVDGGTLSNISGATGECFDVLFRGDYNRVKSLSDIDYLGCFASSFQGYDKPGGVIEGQIRPFDPFYWLFVKLGILQTPMIEPPRSKLRMMIDSMFRR